MGMNVIADDPGEMVGRILVKSRPEADDLLLVGYAEQDRAALAVGEGSDCLENLARVGMRQLSLELQHGAFTTTHQRLDTCPRFNVVLDVIGEPPRRIQRAAV